MAPQIKRYRRKLKHQYPRPSIWGDGPGAERALDRWFAKRNGCDDESTCAQCPQDARLSRLRRMYGRKR